jgi:hypothetical protein
MFQSVSVSVPLACVNELLTYGATVSEHRWHNNVISSSCPRFNLVSPAEPLIWKPVKTNNRVAVRVGRIRLLVNVMVRMTCLQLDMIVRPGIHSASNNVAGYEKPGCGWRSLFGQI